MIKKLVITLLVLIALVAGGAYYLHSNLDSLLQSAIEKYGSQATQTKVNLKKIHIGLTTGVGALNGLTVRNPNGFSSADALSLGAIEVAVDINSLKGTGPIIIRQVKIDQPQITYEVDLSGNTNLQTLARNAQNYAASVAGKKAAAPAEEQKGPARKVIINDLVISNAQMTISQPLLQGKLLAAPLPPIHLTGIGRNSGGATAAQVAQQLLTIITSQATRIASENLIKQLGPKGLVGTGVNGVNEVGNQLLKGVLGK